jgi:large subunit ribosomal protein L6
MSKIGKAPVILPEGVTASVSGQEVSVTGPKGSISRKFSRKVSIEIKDGKILVSATGKEKSTLSVWGTTRAIIAGMVEGVVNGWKKELELVGTGYRAEVQGNTLVLTVGYSHPVKIEAPQGITFKVEKTIITVEGVDKELVGQIAANIRYVRPPEPYKGKGIKYLDEVVRRKAGKAAKAVGAPV